MSEQENMQATAKLRRSRRTQKQNGAPPLPLPLPANDDKEAWKAYWKEQGQPWRTEPEIDADRQHYLTERRETKPNIEQGIYPFKNIEPKLTRADVEWLLATHENGRGPVDWSDESQRSRLGLDLRGADLSQVNLSRLPLTRMQGGLNSAEWYQATQKQLNMAAVHLEGAHLRAASLQGAHLRYAHLEKTQLDFAFLEGAHLRGAYLKRTNLCDAYLDRVRLSNAIISDEKYVGPNLADAKWADTNLAVVKWFQAEMLGDEYDARQKKYDGKVKSKETRLAEYEVAVRANRQFAVVLQSQGLNEDAARFTYRAQLLQREVFWYQRKFGQYLFSLFLALLTGYGYKPIRSFITYAVVISVFAFIYFLLGPHLAWNEAIVISMTAFHGRGFFPEQFKPGDPQALVAAIEAFVGLLIEVTFIATLTQRLFGK